MVLDPEPDLQKILNYYLMGSRMRVCPTDVVPGKVDFTEQTLRGCKLQSDGVGTRTFCRRLPI